MIAIFLIGARYTCRCVSLTNESLFARFGIAYLGAYHLVAIDARVQEIISLQNEVPLLLRLLRASL